jgi:hypothetical protein
VAEGSSVRIRPGTRREIGWVNAGIVRVLGIEKNRYMVFTSRDIQIGYWFQRKFAPAYELAMRVANAQLTKVAERG